MDELEIRPQEGSEASETPEKAAEQTLEDATLEPRAFVEESGDFKQAEAIQENFTAVVDKMIPLTPTGGAEQVGTLPVPLPRTAEEVGQKGVDGILPTPLPRPAEEVGQKGVDGVLPTPLQPAEEVGQNEIKSAAVDHMVAPVLDSLSDLTEEEQLKLQESMENENKKFTVVSNIIKDSHDTAKNAVNNIR